MSGNVDDEAIRRFLSIIGSGYGYGDGSGYGSGYGDGSGYGSGSGSGDGYGYGDGSGYGDGDGSGDGSGYGDGSGDGIKAYGGSQVYMIDCIPTLISSIHGMYAKGYVLQADLTLQPVYIVKVGNSFAHGATLRSARADAAAKDMEARPLAERIRMFAAAHPAQNKHYTGQDLYDWHHILTGSCRAGRDAWCADNGLDPATARMTIAEFCGRTCNAYGGEIIRQLAEYMGIELGNLRRR